MSDHHDFDADQPFEDHHDPTPYDEPAEPPPFDDHYPWDDDAHHDHGPPVDDDEHPAPADHHLPDEPADPATHHESAGDPADDVPAPDVFPPALDVGPLPEPVDGFPWIDAGSLGVPAPAAAADGVDPVRPEELAEYAGQDLPPGADPWAALADSDDPATAALARWWSQN